MYRSIRTEHSFRLPQFIIKYFRKHKDDKADDEDENEKEKNDQEVPKWDSEFLKVDQGTLFGMALSSLDIGSFKDNCHSEGFNAPIINSYSYNITE